MKNIENQILFMNLDETESDDTDFPRREVFLSSLTVEENVPGAGIGILSCTGDKVDITYEIIVGDIAKFEIIGNRLKLKDNVSLIFETQNVYNLIIEASIREKAIATKTFSIQVKDNENSHIAQAAIFNIIAGHSVLNESIGAKNNHDTGNRLSYSLVGRKPSGLVFHSDGSFSFDPSHFDYTHLANGEILPIIFSYKINDGESDSNIAIVTINLIGQEDFSSESDTFDIMEYAPVITDSVHSETIDNGAILSYSLIGKAPFKTSSFVNLTLSASILCMPFLHSQEEISALKSWIL